MTTCAGFWSRLLGVSVFASFTFCTAAVRADEDGRVDAGTQDLVQRGIALRRSGKDEAALDLFLEAEKRAPNSVRVLLHVTTAAQAAGKWLLAYEYLNKASLYREQPYYQRYRGSIHTIEEAIALHIGRLRVLGSPRGAEVLVNGEPLGTLPLSEPKVLEAGSYVLEVRKPGYFPLRRPISISAGLGLSQESIELNQNTTAAPGPESTVARRTEKLPTPSTQGQPTSPLRARWVTWALAGSSAALLTTSGVALAVRENEASHWNDDGRCLDSANPTLTREQRCGDVRDSVKTAERVGIISGALGVGFAGAAVWHYFWSTSVKQEPGRERSAFAATCAAGLGSVVCQGRF
ncbi:MAG TPA: PEGA domain-containing protein [Polyangiaceae bacterium]|nr:PEGA domain-containing protein [Polyangiaceae bacterium]